MCITTVNHYCKRSSHLVASYDIEEFSQITMNLIGIIQHNNKFTISSSEIQAAISALFKINKRLLMQCAALCSNKCIMYNLNRFIGATCIKDCPTINNGHIANEHLFKLWSAIFYHDAQVD